MRRSVEPRCWRRLLLAISICAGCVTVAIQPAAAQFISPDTMLPLPAGTSTGQLSFQYQHNDAFHFDNGVTVPNTQIDTYVGAVQFAHYFQVAGQRLALQIEQGAGWFDNWQVDGFNRNNAAGMRQIGATDTAFTAMYWPYINEPARAYGFLSASVLPPDGSYNENNPVNQGFGGWRGFVQAGVHKGYGENFSLDLAFDAGFFGDRPLPLGMSLSTAPQYRVQLWLNWQWNNGLRASVGYTGIFGGDVTERVLEPTGVGFGPPVFTYWNAPLYRSAELQRLRAALSYWWTPRIETAVELAHDFAAPGGYQLGIGAEARLRVLF